LHSIERNRFVDERLARETFSDPVSGMSPSDTIDYSRAIRSRGAMTVRMISHWEARVTYGHSIPSIAGGSQWWLFSFGKGVKIKNIEDGVAKTAVVSEVLTWDGSVSGVIGSSEDVRGVWMCSSMGASTYSHMTGLNSTIPDHINACEMDSPRDIASDSPLRCQEVPATGDNAGNTYAALDSATFDRILARSASE
jgi:hypothetical protein